MGNILVSILIIMSGAISCFGQGLLKPDQQKQIKEYIGSQKVPVDNEYETYFSSQIYDDKSGNDQKDKTENQAVEELSEEKTPDKPELKIFGHDIFSRPDDIFAPDLVALPPMDYTFGPGDNLIVNIWGRVNQSLNLTVDREGKVFVPKIGELVALGKTLEQFKQNLIDKLSKSYSDFKVSVALGKLRQIRIYVFGEVNKPGGYSVSSLATLLHALYTAEGINDRGSLRNIQLIRHTKILKQYDLYDLLLKGDTGGDLKLLSGDVVYIPVAGPLVSIEGEIKRPAIYELTGKERIADLVELAGGSNPTAIMFSISIDRISQNDNRILKDIDLSDTATFAENNILLQDGDRIKILSIYDHHANMVQLMGNVKHPGRYGLIDSMRISDLIDYGEQLKNNTYTERADLFRTFDNGKKTLIPISLGEVLKGNKDNDLLLQSADILTVYSNKQVTRNKFVTISGEVKKPDRYLLYEDMKLSDLIFHAGNLTKQAYLVECEVARVKPGKEVELIHINLGDIFKDNNLQADILLQEDDCIYIRQIPDWRPLQSVTLEGEVKFPGKYAIRYKGETLSDLLERAGGITLLAFPEGAMYFRQSIEKDLSRRNIGQIINNTMETRFDSLGKIIPDTQVKYQPSQLNRIVIDLPKLLKDRDNSCDIVLADLDYIHIPSIPSGVQVIGAVAANGTISFIKNKKAKHYINQAGGLTPDGNKSDLRLVKPNGKVFFGRKARGKKVELGDAIVVPSKIKSKTDWGKIFTTTATVIGSMATTILVIDRVK